MKKNLTDNTNASSYVNVVINTIVKLTFEGGGAWAVKAIQQIFLDESGKKAGPVTPLECAAVQTAAMVCDAGPGTGDKNCVWPPPGCILEFTKDFLERFGFPDLHLWKAETTNEDSRFKVSIHYGAEEEGYWDNEVKPEAIVTSNSDNNAAVQGLPSPSP